MAGCEVVTRQPRFNDPSSLGRSRMFVISNEAQINAWTSFWLGNNEETPMDFVQGTNFRAISFS